MKGVFRGLLVIGAWSLVILVGYFAVLLVFGVLVLTGGPSVPILRFLPFIGK